VIIYSKLIDKLNNIQSSVEAEFDQIKDLLDKNNRMRFNSNIL